MATKPQVTFLNRDLVEQILCQARDILCQIGLTIHHPEVLSILGDHGAKVDKTSFKAVFTGDLIDRALKSVPGSFKLYDVLGEPTHDFSGDQVHFTPSSSSLNILNIRANTIDRPTTADYITYVKVAGQLPHIASQSTAFIPADVDEKIADAYRLYLGLLYGEKPVVTGTFSAASFKVMYEMQKAVRGSGVRLREKPLTIFTCCPTSPLRWGDMACQNLLDCGRSGIPVELVPVPLSGFISPVTLVGTLVAHTAENLGGLVISQTGCPGAPVLYGGAPAFFDIRHETTPMSAVEAQMVSCGVNEIGKYLGLPTQAYIALSDARMLDAQAGLETSMGAVLAVLSGINQVAGPGGLDFVNTFSIEKLVLDNEICAMAQRLAQGITVREDFPALPLFEELLREKHLLIARHTRRYLKEEHYLPGRVIDRSNLKRFQEQGKKSLGERAGEEVARLTQSYRPSRLADEIKRALSGLMLHEAKRAGMESLPAGSLPGKA